MNNMFKVNMKRGAGFTDTEWAKEEAACYWWAKAWNDPAFQDQVLYFSYPWQVNPGVRFWKKKIVVTVRDFAYCPKPRTVILSKMLSGSENLKPGDDETADGEIVCGNQKGVLGWTNPGTLKVWVSRWFLQSASIAELAGNRAHEYCHKLGFGHPFDPTPTRPYSVPYAIGRITRDWVLKNYVKGEFSATL
jgi:hypothetical protein